MPPKANFTPKQIERMKEMKSEGFTARDIARRFGVHHSTVTAYLRGERNHLEEKKPASDVTLECAGDTPKS